MQLFHVPVGRFPGSDAGLSQNVLDRYLILLLFHLESLYNMILLFDEIYLGLQLYFVHLHLFGLQVELCLQFIVCLARLAVLGLQLVDQHLPTVLKVVVFHVLLEEEFLDLDE